MGDTVNSAINTTAIRYALRSDIPSLRNAARALMLAALRKSEGDLVQVGKLLGIRKWATVKELVELDPDLVKARKLAAAPRAGRKLGRGKGRLPSDMG